MCIRDRREAAWAGAAFALLACLSRFYCPRRFLLLPILSVLCLLYTSKTVYKEWEIGTYYSAWRVVREGIVLCGSQDVVDSIDELNLSLGRIGLGRFMSLRQFSDLDVRIEFDSGVAVDFLATTSDDDECLHIFCPGERCIEFSVRGGWKAGPSDRRWPEKRASLKPKQRP